MCQLRFIGVIGLAIACLASTGCITKEQNGDATVYYFEWWTWSLCLLAGVFMVWLGWKIRRGWRGWLILVGGFFVGLGVAPGLAVETLTVDREHFDLKRGTWFDSYHLRFDEIASIDLTAKERRTRRGKRTDYNLLCRFRNGGTETVPVGDLMKRGLGQVLEYAEDKGVVVTDRTGQLNRR